jgi:hypothetical protein
MQQVPSLVLWALVKKFRTRGLHVEIHSFVWVPMV